MTIRRMFLIFLAGVLCAFHGEAAAARNAGDAVRYFEYWSEYGENMSGTEFRKASFSLSRGKVSIFISRDGLSENYAGPACREDLLRSFSDAAAKLDFSKCETPLTERKFDSLGKEEKKNYCRWHMTILYEPHTTGEAGREVRFDGADNGSNPGRMSAEKAFLEFFGSRLKTLQSACPKHIDVLQWSMPAGEGQAHYSLSAEEGRVRLWRLLNHKSLECLVYPEIMQETAALLEGADSWNGAGKDVQDRKHPAFMEFSLRYDTQQSVYAKGYADRPETEGMRNVLGRLGSLCDKTAAMAEKPELQPGQLRKFHFYQSDSRMGAYPGYTLYRRVDREGPVVVLERQTGRVVAEGLISENDVRELERILEECGIASWNGFSGNARNVLDGRSFGLNAEFAGGREISAHGYMRFPRNYGSVKERVFPFLDGLLDRNGAVITREK